MFPLQCHKARTKRPLFPQDFSLHFRPETKGIFVLQRLLVSDCKKMAS